MARGKPQRTKEVSQAQAHRTAKNQIRRFTKNLDQRPNHPHSKVWISKMEKYEKVLA